MIEIRLTTSSALLVFDWNWFVSQKIIRTLSIEILPNPKRQGRISACLKASIRPELNPPQAGYVQTTMIVENPLLNAICLDFQFRLMAEKDGRPVEPYQCFSIRCLIQHCLPTRRAICMKLLCFCIAQVKLHFLLRLEPRTHKTQQNQQL